MHTKIYKSKISFVLIQIAFLLIGILYVQSSYALDRMAPALVKQQRLANGKEGAEVLYAIKKTLVRADFSTLKTYYYSIKINDEISARDYGRIAIHFSEYYSDLTLTFANVLTPEGEIKQVSSDAIQKKSGASQDFYEERAILTFAPPQISPGSILEFQYEVRSIKTTIPNFYSDTSDNFWYQPTLNGRGARIDKVHRATFLVELSENTALEAQVLGSKKPAKKRKHNGETLIYEWTWKNLRAIPVEKSMPWYEELVSRVRVSTTRDWRQLDSWSWGLLKDKILPTEKIKNIAAQLVPDNASKEEKLKAVYSYLQNNVRYVYAHLGRGGYEPHKPIEVIHQAYGDCKDQAILAISLLRAMSVDAYPALVVTPRADRPSTELVGMYFDHMIVWVPSGDDSGMWLDTTPYKHAFPGMSATLNEQPAFILDGAGGKITTIKAKEIKNHSIVNFKYRVNKDAELNLDISIIFSGRFDENIRNWWLYVEKKEQALDRLIRSPFDNLSPESVTDAKILNVGSFSESVRINGRIEFGKASVSNDGSFRIGGGVNQLFRMLGDFSTLPLPKSRSQDWIKSSEDSMTMNLTIDAGDNRYLSVFQSAFDIKNEFFKIEQIATKKDKDVLIKIEYSHSPIRLNAPRYKIYYDEVFAIYDQPNWEIGVFPSDVKQSDDKKHLQNKNTGSVGNLISAKLLIHEGKFKEAVAAANLAIEFDPLDGEAWYVLGTAQGFDIDISGSKRSYEKSRELGFFPD